MTPHEHYKHAEGCLAQAEELSWGATEIIEVLLKKAQVHATLASVVSWPTEER